MIGLTYFWRLSYLNWLWPSIYHGNELNQGLCQQSFDSWRIDHEGLKLWWFQNKNQIERVIHELRVETEILLKSSISWNRIKRLLTYHSKVALSQKVYNGINSNFQKRNTRKQPSYVCKNFKDLLIYLWLMNSYFFVSIILGHTLVSWSPWPWQASWITQGILFVWYIICVKVCFDQG